MWKTVADLARLYFLGSPVSASMSFDLQSIQVTTLTPCSPLRTCRPLARRVQIVVPKRGDRRKLLALTVRNAELALAERNRRERRMDETLDDLADLLRVPEPPSRIECYDVSHLHGTLHVASRVVFVDGQPDKDGYRRYRPNGST